MKIPTRPIPRSLRAIFPQRVRKMTAFRSDAEREFDAAWSSALDEDAAARRAVLDEIDAVLARLRAALDEIDDEPTEFEPDSNGTLGIHQGVQTP